MNLRTRAWIATLSATASSFALISAAQAQQTSPTGEDANVLTEIVVTAQRRAESLQDVPMSVDVATGEQIERLNIFDAKDVQQLSPGLQLQNNDGRSNTATLRGISFNPDQGTSPAVDLYLNEAPVDAQTAFTAIYDIEQIEVLRGPQGALRGRTSPAGAITFRTRRANLDEFEGYVQGTYSDAAAWNVQGGVSIPIVPGKFAMRVAALTDGNRGNQVYNIPQGEYSRSRTESARVSFQFEPSDALTANLTYQYLNAKNRLFPQVFGPGAVPTSPLFGPGPASGPPLTVEDYASVQEGPAQFDNESQFLNFNVDWDLGPATLTLLASHQDTLLIQARDQDPNNSIPGYFAAQRNRIPYNVDIAEVRLASNNDGFWNWSLSTFASKQTGMTQVRQDASQFFTNAPYSFGLYFPISAAIDIPVDSKTLAFAASSSFQFTDQLRFEAGIRYTKIENVQAGTVTSTSPGVPGLGIPAFTVTQELIPARLARTEEDPITGGATLTYEYDPDTTAYLAYGRSFRAGTAGVATPLFISDSLIKTDSETSDAFELGLKKNLFDRRLSVNFAAFYQKFDGYISRVGGVFYDNGPRVNGVAVGGPPDGIVDGSFDFNWNGDATVKGIELTVAGRPIENWDFSVAASYVKARYDNAQSPCNDFNGDGVPDVSGTPVITGGGNVSYCPRTDRISEIPDFNMTANTEIRFPVGDLVPFVRALFTYRPSLNSTLAQYKYDSRELLNLYVGVKDSEERWEVNVFAKNVFDQQVITNIGGVGQTSTSTPGVVYNSGYRGINTTQPREFGVTAKYNF
jgi:iron complex outermembrane recepter protein